MPILFWVEIVAYSIAAISAFTLGLMVLATAPKQKLNRFFALFTLLEAIWAISAVLMRINLVLANGNATFWLELAALAINAMGFILPAFAIRYVERRSKRVDWFVLLGFISLAIIIVPMFRGLLLFNPSLTKNGLSTYEVTQLGYTLPLLPIPYFLLSFVIFWRNRQQTKSTYLAVSTLALVSGFLLGGMLRPFFPVPILSITVATSVLIMGYGVVNRQLFNPLQELTEQLEQRVRERTQELQASRDALAAQAIETERRAQYLEAVADVAREASSLLELDKLLSKLADLIAERFDLFGIGIFLLDTNKKWAILEATSGNDSLKQLLMKDFRIPITGEGIIAHVINTGLPYMTGNANQDSIYLEIEALADIQSELTLPLIARNEILGTISIQSPELNAFSDEDITVMQTLADQVGLAISNTKLFEEVQERLETERRIYGELSRKAWRELLQDQDSIAFLRDEEGVSRIDKWIDPEVEEVLKTGKTIKSPGDEANLGVPIRVRGQVIGVIDTHKQTGEEGWNEEEISLVEALADQVSEALEAARLYQDTQRRAARERTTSEITDKMRRAAGVEKIIQTALNELSEALGTSRAYVQLGSDTEKLTKTAQEDKLQVTEDVANNTSSGDFQSNENSLEMSDIPNTEEDKEDLGESNDD